MGEPIAIPPMVRETLRGILLKQHRSGVKFRSREKRLADILGMVRMEWPDAQMEQLVDDELSYLKAERRDEECQYYKNTRRCPGGCGNIGRLWFVERRDTRNGPEYFVKYHSCGIYQTWVDEKAAATEEKAAVKPYQAFFMKVNPDAESA